MIHTATNEMRWFRKGQQNRMDVNGVTWDMGTTYTLELQQKWVDETGVEHWKEVPIVSETQGFSFVDSSLKTH